MYDFVDCMHYVFGAANYQTEDGCWIANDKGVVTVTFEEIPAQKQDFHTYFLVLKRTMEGQAGNAYTFSKRLGLKIPHAQTTKEVCVQLHETYRVYLSLCKRMC